MDGQYVCYTDVVVNDFLLKRYLMRTFHIEATVGWQRWEKILVIDACAMRRAEASAYPRTHSPQTTVVLSVLVLAGDEAMKTASEYIL